jgi:hypothetical protein
MVNMKGPKDLNLVLDIIRLRDEENLSWRDIAVYADTTHQNICLLYRRWKNRLYARRYGQAMADIMELPPPKRKSRVSKYPHGAPREPDKLLEIARLRDEENLNWRAIGPKLNISPQGACLLYNLWKKRGWFNPEDKQEEQEEQEEQNEQDKQDEPA